MRLAAMIGLLVALAGPAAAQGLGGFAADSDLPDVILFHGEITEDSPRALIRALEAAPGTRAIWLDSIGGAVFSALEMADEIHARGLATVIAPEAICASACAYVFMAGHDRVALGGLGVHQFASDTPGGWGGLGEGEAQSVAAAILERMSTFGAPPRFMVKMLETPNDDMYWFTADELVSDGIVTGGAEWEALARARPANPGKSQTNRNADAGTGSAPVGGSNRTEYESGQSGTPTPRTGNNPFRNRPVYMPPYKAGTIAGRPFDPDRNPFD